MTRRLRRASRDRSGHLASFVEPSASQRVEFDFLTAAPVAQQRHDVGASEAMSQGMRFIRDRCISEGDVIFDCGAHHGAVATLFSKWTGETGAVLAFEPIRRNAAAIRANIELNQIHNILVEEKALADTSAAGACLKAGSGAYAMARADGEYAAAMTDLDAYAHLRPHLLLIDVDGYEIEVLKGARQVLRRRPKLVITIYADRFDSPARRIGELFSLIDIDTYETWIQWHHASAPEHYDRRTPIGRRARLYALPLQKD